MNYNIDFGICSLIFMALLFFWVASKKPLETFQSKVLRLYMGVIFGNICLGLITCYTNAYFNSLPLGMHYLLNMVLLSLQFFTPTMLVLYIFTRHYKEGEYNTKILYALLIPAIIGIVLSLTNVFSRLMYFVDTEGFHQGVLYPYRHINAALYCLGALVYLIIVHKRLQKNELLSAIFMILACAVPYALRLWWVRDGFVNGIGMTVCTYIMYFTNESIISYVDNTTKALNREAFAYHMAVSHKNMVPEQIYVLALDNFKIINEVYGMDGGDAVMRMLVSALKKEYTSKAVFRISGDTFAVVVGETEEPVKVRDRLNRIIGRTWNVHDMEVEISSCICLIHSIHYQSDDLIRAIDYAVAKAKEIGKGQFYEVTAESSGDMKRRAAIEQAMMASIESGHFEVHYQPIYDTHEHKFHSMEALARLNVPEYGYVSPEEFILIAEQNGTVLQIGLLVLEEVCRFIKQYHLRRRGIAFIEVNLSVVQCMQEHIYNDILGILERYHVPPSMINLEITESAAAYSEKRLIQNMARLSLTDITFSLDDYGSGYSNIQYLVDLPFNIVKIDKYIVWAAMKKVSSRKVLGNTIAMFKDINLKVVTEGIEDLEMVEMVTSMGADYLQGYFFSKPVPKEKLIECLEEGYLEKLFEG